METVYDVIGDRTTLAAICTNCPHGGVLNWALRHGRAAPGVAVRLAQLPGLGGTVDGARVMASLFSDYAVVAGIGHGAAVAAIMPSITATNLALLLVVFGARPGMYGQ